jgi:hypothetical protein
MTTPPTIPINGSRNRQVVVGVAVVLVVIVSVVLVLVLVVVVMIVLVRMPVVVPDIEQLHAREVHEQSHDRHRKGLAERDRKRMREPQHRFVHHPESDDGEDDRARVTGERVDLARTEAERGLARASASEPICERRHSERAGMRGHVPTVRRQREGVRPIPDDELADHHRAGENDDPARPRFVYGGGDPVVVIVPQFFEESR